jgi:hypothetical protein
MTEPALTISAPAADKRHFGLWLPMTPPTRGDSGNPNRALATRFGASVRAHARPGEPARTGVKPPPLHPLIG